LGGIIIAILEGGIIESKPNSGLALRHRYIIDCDGDKKSDICLLSLKNNAIYFRGASHYKIRSFFYPLFPFFGDFNGDEKSEIGFFSNGFAYIVGLIMTNLGRTGDIPVVADYDGDGQTDIAVWRAEGGIWVTKHRETFSWGDAQDVPLPLDYDGDNRADPAVWRPKEGNWYLKLSSGEAITIPWGSEGDIPVPGDYTGDGKADLAVWRPANGNWLIKTENDLLSLVWGASGDIPVPGDYDGDGKTEPAVWRPTEQKWYIFNQEAINFGQADDLPLTWNSWILWARKLIKSK